MHFCTNIILHPNSILTKTSPIIVLLSPFSSIQTIFTSLLCLCKINISILYSIENRLRLLNSLPLNLKALKNISFSIQFYSRTITTTGLASSLFWPYKGLLQALGLKTHWKILHLQHHLLAEPHGFFLFVSFYLLTRKLVNILF